MKIGDATLYLGDVLSVLAMLPDESVHCVVTSPPYWGLRDYGCDGQIGLEETPEEYVAKMVAVFREVRRVLRRDGTAWVNLGDSYVGGGRGFGGEGTRESARSEQGRIVGPPTGAIAGLKPKDLVGIPWRVAFALQADGWYLRSDIIWAKPNPMPESVTDRPTKAHEYLFLLSKSARYFYDADAVREQGPTYTRKAGGYYGRDGQNASRFGGKGGFGDSDVTTVGRNRRTVWTIATEPFPGAHFATYPRKLVEPCILAGCPRKVCPDCGAPWEREVERYAKPAGRSEGDIYTAKAYASPQSSVWGSKRNLGGDPRETRTIGEHPTCDHGLPPVPGTVLEPFCGSGTTLVVALTHGRRAVGIELKPDYFEMACNRLRHGTVDPEEVRQAESQFALFDVGAQGSTP